MSVAVHNHYKRLNHETKNNKDIELSIKYIVSWTHWLRKNFISTNFSENFRCAFYWQMQLHLQAGYVGEDVENIILKLLQAADYNVESSKRYCIY